MYNSKTFSVLAYANGFTLWHYKTPDKLSNVLNTNYFKEAKTFVRSGDAIIVNANDDKSFAFTFVNNNENNINLVPICKKETGDKNE